MNFRNIGAGDFFISSTWVLSAGLFLLACDETSGTAAATGGGAATSGTSFGSGGTAMGTGTGATGTQSGGAGTGTPSGAGGTSAGGTSAGGASSTGGSSQTGNTGGSGSGDATCEVGNWDDSPPQTLDLTGNTFAHDPTMIEVDGTYYRFWTGDYIPSATSTNLTHWTNAPSVYDGDYPAWSDEWLSDINGETFNFPWAPDVSAFNDQVHIYSSFSAIFGDNISCITHLSTSDISAGDWTDHGPVICSEGNESYNAIDADVALDGDGTPWLSFGSFWDGIYAFELNADGSRKNDQMTHLAWASEIEAPVLFYRCGYYYLFVTWGLCCPGEGRSVDDLSYRVAVGRSTNIAGPYVDKDGVAMTEGGGTLIVEGDGEEWAAAGHSDVIVSDDQVYHLYHAYRQSNGSAAFRISELPFDEDGWPVPHDP